MDAAGILSAFIGFAVHDHWGPYVAYQQVIHVLCNAHHSRELTFVHEQEKEVRAGRMKGLLVRAKEQAEQYEQQGNLPLTLLRQLERSYKEIIEAGLQHHARLPSLSQKTRGKPKQRPGKNLLDRLKEKQTCVLWFLYHSAVPLTNNQAEQDIRMVKLKQKVSGCFRTLRRGQIFCRNRRHGWQCSSASGEPLVALKTG